MNRASTYAGVVAVAVTVGCQDAGPVHPLAGSAEVRALAVARGMRPIPPPPPIRGPLVELGRMLAFDKILSGDRDVACMSCHLPSRATSDGLSVSVGVRGTGLGPDRTGGVLIARNSLALFNLHRSRPLFWDGRLETESPGVLRTPAGAAMTPDLARAFEFGPLSALGLFPVLSREEMREFSGNELAEIPDAEIGAIWEGIFSRLGAIEEYRGLFEAAYPGVAFEAMNAAHMSNAIAAFLSTGFSATNTAWDRFLAGDDDALSGEQVAGARIFLREGRCAECHSGPDLSDGRFHNTALPQLGPGRGDGPGGLDDFGREAVTGLPQERYAFRTPPLRNVELTAPYGHAGQFESLREMIDHYDRSDVKLREYDASHLDAPLRVTVRTDASILSTRDRRLDGLVLTREQVELLEAFLRALTDERSRAMDRVVPLRVPSGLPIDR